MKVLINFCFGRNCRVDLESKWEEIRKSIFAYPTKPDVSDVTRCFVEILLLHGLIGALEVNDVKDLVGRVVCADEPNV